MTAAADSAGTAGSADLVVSAPAESSQAQQNERLWHALGYYAVGELSVGHTQNALYAYRLLNALEPFEERWKLGRAFCALTLSLLDESQKTLAAFSESPRLADPSQEKLLRQCRERLAYLQRKKSTTPVADRTQSDGNQHDGSQHDGSQRKQRKVLHFPRSPSAPR